MSYLTDAQLADIQTFVDNTEARLWDMGLTLSVDGDLANWVQHMRQAPGTLRVAATHDPAYSHVHPGNAFWARFENNAGSIIACIAHKVVVTDNLLDEVRSHRLFFNRQPILRHYPVALCVVEDVPTLSGHIGYTGGLWVHPDYRGREISGIMARLCRNLSVRHFYIDWNVGFIADTPSRTKMGLEGYGMAHSTPLLKGVFPLSGENRDMQMFYMSKEEMLSQIRRENQSSMKSGVGGVRGETP
ncbi:MAG: hypothetical protein GKS00_27905 [Alphaproteobacteria bacterium]|nr:hypothetical protein [Alphaproteobacteria bacterium]